MIELKFYQDIPTIKALQGTIKALEKIVDTEKHEIRVRLLHSPCISMDEKGEMIQSMFFVSNKQPWINLALDLKEYAMFNATSEAAAYDSLEESLIHELCHYEQFRDGKKLTERGVKIRSENILKQLLGE